MKIEKEHTKNTLMHWSKEELIERVMCLECNVNVIYEKFESQYRNCMILLNAMQLVNEEFKKQGAE